MALCVDVFWKKLNKHAHIPKYMSEQASGMDLYACLEDNPDFPNDTLILQPHETRTVPLGLAVELPDGYEMQIRPRSGISKKTKLRLPNTPGTIDADYRGEVGVLVENISVMGVVVVKHGERIAQGVIAPVVRANNCEALELSDTVRGDGGYGTSPEEGY